MKPNPQRIALKHGAYALGKLPRGASYISRQVHALRRALEQAVTARQPAAVTLTDAAHINRACRMETQALLWQRWLRVEDKLSVSERLEISKLILNCTEARDRAIAALGLEQAETNFWQQLQAARAAKAGGEHEQA